MTSSKFTALAIGQRFALRGKYFVKISPLLARAEDGGQSQMIARSAYVDLLDAAAVSQITRRPAHAAVDTLYSAALTCMDELANSCAAPAQALRQAREQLDKAHQRALAQLDEDN
jgi:hypothetical protein